jgi:hypothetical protein
MDPCRGCRALTLRPSQLPRQPVRRRPPTLPSRRRLGRLAKPSTSMRTWSASPALTSPEHSREGEGCGRVPRPGHRLDHYQRSMETIFDPDLNETNSQSCVGYPNCRTAVFASGCLTGGRGRR